MLLYLHPSPQRKFASVGGGGSCSQHATGSTTMLDLHLYLTDLLHLVSMDQFFSIMPDVFISSWSANSLAAAPPLIL